MNIHEYQAKEILKNFGLPVLQGKSYCKNLDTLHADIEDLNGPPWVVKSQIHAGGRGAGHFKNSFNDKGGVQVVFEKKDVPSIAQSMMGNVLVTKQTGEAGKIVNRIFIEEGCDIDREFYLSLLVDRSNSKGSSSVKSFNSTNSGCRNKALSSKLILASNKTKFPCLFKTSGLISIVDASIEVKIFNNLLIIEVKSSS